MLKKLGVGVLVSMSIPFDWIEDRCNDPVVDTCCLYAIFDSGLEIKPTNS